MTDTRIGIVGYGSVGRAVANLFTGAVIHDPPQGMEDMEGINTCAITFVCVPTPRLPNGQCDTSCVEEAVAWIESEVIVIRSTVPPGTTNRLARQYGKCVVFQPEYGPGETPDHPYRDLASIPWVTLGGPREWTRPVAHLYQRVRNSTLSIRQTDATSAELAKYMENAFLATKVAFCNEFYDLAGALGVDYHELRELWLMDPRIGRSHTWVHPDDRGFGGKCLPKDLDAIVQVAREMRCDPTLLEAVASSNAAVRGRMETE